VCIAHSKGLAVIFALSQCTVAQTTGLIGSRDITNLVTIIERCAQNAETSVLALTCGSTFGQVVRRAILIS